MLPSPFLLFSSQVPLPHPLPPYFLLLPHPQITNKWQPGVYLSTPYPLLRLSLGNKWTERVGLRKQNHTVHTAQQNAFPT